MRKRGDWSLSGLTALSYFESCTQRPRRKLSDTTLPLPSVNLSNSCRWNAKLCTRGEEPLHTPSEEGRAGQWVVVAVHDLQPDVRVTADAAEDGLLGNLNAHSLRNDSCASG